MPFQLRGTGPSQAKFFTIMQASYQTVCILGGREYHRVLTGSQYEYKFLSAL